jgi:glutaredoxin
MITVYSTPNCTKCNAIKAMYKAHNIEFEEKIIGADISKEDLEALTGTELRSAPVIMNESTYIGGLVEGISFAHKVKDEQRASLEKQMMDELKSIGISL